MPRGVRSTVFGSAATRNAQIVPSSKRAIRPAYGRVASELIPTGW